MKPILLTLSGLQSYRDRQTIDFRPMQGCGLFGIFGPTGSGKSTILDGMTLALYGSISRASHNTQGMINSLCSSVSVSFTFELQMRRECQIFRVERVYRRKKQAVGSCEPRLCRLVRLAAPDAETGVVLADKPTDVNQHIEKLLGLHYADFTRAVVLPQNQFQEFLLLGKKDKSDMLERLFCLEEYGQELSRKIAQSRKQAEDEMHKATGSLDVLQDYSEDAVSLARQNASICASARKQAAAAFDAAKAKYLSGQGIYQLSCQKKQLLDQQLLLNDQIMAIDADRERLKKARLAEPIWPLSQENETLTAEMQKLQTDLAAMAEQADALALELVLSRQRLDCNRRAAEPQKASLANQINQLEKADSLIDQKEALLEKTSRLSSQIRQLSDQEKAASQSVLLLEKQSVDQQGNLQEIRQNRQTMQVDQNWRQTLEAWLQLQDQHQKTLQEIQAENERRRKLTDEVKQAAEQYALVSREVSEEQATVLVQAARQLQDNVPCPLCGSGHHPHPAHLRTRETALIHEEDRTKLHRLLVQSEERLAFCQTQIASLGEKHAEISTQIDQYAKADPRLIGLADPAESLRQLYRQEKRQAELDCQIQKAALDCQMLQEQLHQESSQLIRFTGQLSGLSQMEKEFAGQLNLLWHELAELLPSWPPEWFTHENILQHLAKLRQTAIEIDRIGQELSEKHQQLDEQNNVSLQQNMIWKTRLDLLLERQERLAGQLGQAIADAGFHSLAELQQAHLEPGALNALAKKLQQCDDNSRDLLLQLRQCDKQLDGNWLDEPDWKIIEAEYDLAVQMQEQSVRQDDLANHQLAEILERNSQRKAKEAEYAAAKIRSERISQIDQLVRGNAFVEYVAEERLRAIAAEATEYLETMTRYRYALELDADMAFVVRDQMNGGEVRMATSLSGGETFMASLALALALSSQIQIRGQSKLAFFFLDEGFGSLDSDLLDLVIDSLERISSSERMIGLISHVPELKHRIANRLVVAPASGREGSRIDLERGDCS